MPSASDYTVGWIAALPVENTAALILLDNIHPNSPASSNRDSNVYTLGDIHGHNIVVATLPYGQYGLSSATSVAKDMLRSFPNIRFGLMVGIGGGAPSEKNDIRLGDIVVSAPCNDGHGGVLQYDFGKLHDDGSFEMTKHLNQPPNILLSAVAQLITEYAISGQQTQHDILQVLESKPSLRETFRRPDDRTDRLYHSNFPHPAPDILCEKCCGDDENNVQRREDRGTSSGPRVHHGLVASANQLLKNAKVRDRGAQAGVLCFEMEAAGLMNDFPCLVVRGICDYADSHKNKQWQGYAALTAAMYAKDILSKIPPCKVEGESRITESMLDVGQILTSVQIQWLRLPDVWQNLRQAREKRLAETGHWLIESEEFDDWRRQHTSLFWLKGVAGSGKTCLSSIVIDSLSNQGANVLFFYFDSLTAKNDIGNQDKTSTDSMLRSLIYQLHKVQGDRNDEKDLFKYFENGARQPSTLELSDHFKRVATKGRELWIIFDAIDECKDWGKDTLGLANWIEGLMKETKLSIHILVTSRVEYDIETRLNVWPTTTVVVQMSKKRVQPDINLFIRNKLEEDGVLCQWKKIDDIWIQMQDALITKSHGMFLLAVLQLAHLRKCNNRAEILKTLEDLPEDLTKIYNEMLDNTPPQLRDGAIRLLQLLTYSERPLRMDEVMDGLAVNLERDPAFDPRLRVPKDAWIRRYCPNFVQINESEKYVNGSESKILEIQLAHPSMKDHLTSPHLHPLFQPYLNEQKAGWTLALVCLSYLLELHENLSFEDANSKLPFAHYSSGNWMRHAAVCKNRLDRLQPLIIKFLLSPQFTRSLAICDPESTWNAAPHYLSYKPGGPLYYAALAGLDVELKSLLQEHIDPNAHGGKYGTALQAACYRGCIEAARLLVGAGADLNPVSIDDSDTKLESGVGKYGCPLQAASRKGHLDIVEFLLRAGANVNAVGGRWGTSLQASATKKKPALVNALLRAGAYIDIPTGKYGTSLQAASVYGHLEIVSILLEAGGSPNARGFGYGTPIYAAAFHGHEKVVEALIDNGACINIQCNQEMDPLIMPSQNDWLFLDYIDDRLDHGYKVPRRILDTLKIRCPLYGACLAGNEAICDLLLDRGADPNFKCGGHGTSLMAACWSGNKAIVNNLIKKGARVNDEAGHFGTALQVSAYRDMFDIVQLLLENGAQINYQAGQHGTALQAACFQGNIGMVGFLLKKRADPNVCGIQGSPLQSACHQKHEEIVRLLLHSDANVHLQCGWFGNALQSAAFGGHLGIIKVLFDRDPMLDTNISAGVYGTPLFAAAYKGHIDVLKYLLARKADVNGLGGNYEEFIEGLEDRDGMCLDPIEYGGEIFTAISLRTRESRFCKETKRFGTVLYGSCYQGDCNIVEFLLHSGANPDVPGGRYGSALHVAVFWGRYELVSLLIQYKANIDIEDRHGKTPLFRAVESGRHRIVELLLRKGADPNRGKSSAGTPLHISLHLEDNGILELLLTWQPDLEREGCELGTVLSRAALMGKADVVKRLLKIEGIKAEHGGILGTPLQAACFAGHQDIVDLLLEHGVKPEYGGDWDQALVFAASQGYGSMVERLIDSGADLNFRHEALGTAIEAARRWMHAGLVELLQKHGADEAPTPVIIDEAIDYYTKELENSKTTRGTRHPKTIKIMNVLSLILMNSTVKDHSRAIDLMEEVYKVRSEELGESALDTIQARAELALAFASERNIDRATGLFCKVADAYRNTYGFCQEAIEAEMRLVYILIWQGEIDGAFGRMIKILPKGLANLHFPDIFVTLGRRDGCKILMQHIKQHFLKAYDVNIII